MEMGITMEPKFVDKGVKSEDEGPDGVGGLVFVGR
jgi:hypothetical protein